MTIDMLLYCPVCCTRHLDEGEFATKDHHTHACQHCGTCWRPAVESTRGVLFLPGFKNDVVKISTPSRYDLYLAVSDSPRVDETLRNFLANPTQDNAVGVVQAVIEVTT